MNRKLARRRAGLIAVMCIAAASCAAPPPAQDQAQRAGAAPASLSATEQAAGWRLLFDGVTTAGWRNYNRDGLDPRWGVEDGALALSAGGGGDIITADQFENFELAFEWRISEGGNSGVLFGVVEGDYDAVYHTGPEYQILDDARHPDGADPTHRAGANYDLHAPRVAAARDVGEYNEALLIVDHGRVQHWLNGELIVEYELWTPQWEAMVAESKFASMPDYGRARAGHIALQDHGDRVWYRNIKLRPL